MPVLSNQPTTLDKVPTPKGKAKVLNPDRSNLSFKFNAVEYKLPSGELTELSREVAEHGVRTLSMWGVTIIDKSEDIIVAKILHKAGVTSWAKEELEAYYKKNPHLRPADAPKSDELKSAEEWLQSER